jgi:hypothetical protein
MLMVASPAGDVPLEVYGDAAPMAVDWNGDGVWDLLVGDFVDTITCFRNIGTADAPRFAAGVKARTPDGVLHLPQNMHKTRAIDLDRDGQFDLVSGSEDGFIYWSRGLGLRNGVPTFAPPVRLQQLDPPLAVGVLAVPAAADWDGDGDLDLICGNAAGYLEFVENIGTRQAPRFALPVRLEAAGEVIRIQAGYRGSMQGPSESKWGYTTPAVVDWDGDGLLDILHSDITGQHLWYRNIGTRTRPRLAAPRPIRVAGKPLRTVWRTRPLAVDWNGDGLPDYICLDEHGILTYYERARAGGRLVLREGRRFRFPDGSPVKLDGEAGLCGRANLAGGDWFGRGRIDICCGPYHGAGPDVDPETIYLMESLDPANLVMGFPKAVRRRDGTPIKQGGSYPAPEIADWDGDGRADLLLGCEDGSIWFFPRDSVTP